MPKTNMATFQRLVVLGIIVIFTGYFVNSTPASIPKKTVSDGEDADADHKENEIKKFVESRQEEQTSELTVHSIGVKLNSFIWDLRAVLKLHCSCAGFLTNEILFYFFH